MLGGEPSRGLLDNRQEEHHDSDGDDLEPDRDSPLDSSSRCGVLGDGVVDPDQLDWPLSEMEI